MGDWELLAIKLALDQWLHWLEGAAQPFFDENQVMSHTSFNIE